MPISATAYAERKAQGRCVRHGTRPARPGQVLCQQCVDAQAAYRALNRTPDEQRIFLLRQRMRERRVFLVPPASATPPSGPNLLLCCGHWWPITHIPLLVPCCDRLWFQQTKD